MQIDFKDEKQTVNEAREISFFVDRVIGKIDDMIQTLDDDNIMLTSYSSNPRVQLLLNSTLLACSRIFALTTLLDHTPRDEAAKLFAEVSRRVFENEFNYAVFKMESKGHPVRSVH